MTDIANTTGTNITADELNALAEFGVLNELLDDAFKESGEVVSGIRRRSDLLVGAYRQAYLVDALCAALTLSIFHVVRQKAAARDATFHRRVSEMEKALRKDAAFDATDFQRRINGLLIRRDTVKLHNAVPAKKPAARGTTNG